MRFDQVLPFPAQGVPPWPTNQYLQRTVQQSRCADSRRRFHQRHDYSTVSRCQPGTAAPNFKSGQIVDCVEDSVDNLLLQFPLVALIVAAQQIELNAEPEDGTAGLIAEAQG